MIFIKIFYGLIFLAGGIATLKYRKNVYDWTGRFVWAERYFGSGGTVFVITLIGLLFIFLSVAYPAGVFDTKDKMGSLDRLEKKYDTNNANTGNDTSK